jgi:hypothetical protein
LSRACPQEAHSGKLGEDGSRDGLLNFYFKENELGVQERLKSWKF